MTWKWPTKAGTVKLKLIESEELIEKGEVTGYIGHARVYVGDGIYVLVHLHAWVDAGHGPFKLGVTWPIKADKLAFDDATQELRWTRIVVDAVAEQFADLHEKAERAETQRRKKEPLPKDDLDFQQFFREQEAGYQRFQGTQKEWREKYKKASKDRPNRPHERPIPPPPPPRETWEIFLGLRGTETKEEARRVWHKLCRAAHPDLHGGDGTRMRAINEAYQALKKFKGWD